MHKEKLIELIDAATVVKDESGKIHVKETANHTKKDMGKGLAIGAVFGIIFPPSIIASAIVGGAAGGLFGHFTRRGLARKISRKLGASLTPVRLASSRWLSTNSRIRSRRAWRAMPS